MDLLFLLEAQTSLSTVGTAEGFCADTWEIWQLVGKILMVLIINTISLSIIYYFLKIHKTNQ